MRWPRATPTPCSMRSRRRGGTWPAHRARAGAAAGSSHRCRRSHRRCGAAHRGSRSPRNHAPGEAGQAGGPPAAITAGDGRCAAPRDQRLVPHHRRHRVVCHGFVPGREAHGFQQGNDQDAVLGGECRRREGSRASVPGWLLKVCSRSDPAAFSAASRLGSIGSAVVASQRCSVSRWSPREKRTAIPGR